MNEGNPDSQAHQSKGHATHAVVVTRGHTSPTFDRSVLSRSGRSLCSVLLKVRAEATMQGLSPRGLKGGGVSEEGGGSGTQKCVYQKMPPSDFPNAKSRCFPRWSLWSGGGGIWHKASVFCCLPLAAPIGLSLLHILTLCGPKRGLVVSTELGVGGGVTPPPSSCGARPFSYFPGAPPYGCWTLQEARLSNCSGPSEHAGLCTAGRPWGMPARARHRPLWHWRPQSPTREAQHCAGGRSRGCRNGREKKNSGVSNAPYDGGRWVTDGGRWVTDGGWCVTDGGWWVTDGGRWVTDGGRWVTDGGWWVTDGGWWVTDGGWRVTDGGWRVTDGGWWVTDGGWWVTDGGWWVTDGGWWVATKHQKVDAIVKQKKRVSILMAPPGQETCGSGKAPFRPLAGTTAESALLGGPGDIADGYGVAQMAGVMPLAEGWCCHGVGLGAEYLQRTRRRGGGQENGCAGFQLRGRGLIQPPG